jgi:uncharacterized protein (TIGR02466 family)
MEHLKLFPTSLFHWVDVLSPQDFETTKNVVQVDKDHVDIPVLKDYITNIAVKEIMGSLGISPNYTVEITEMWGNILYMGDDHECHNHPNHVFSGIFYLTEGSPTHFIDPRPANSVFRLNIDPHNDSSTKVAIRAVPNQLLIFDSWLLHYVKTNKTPNTRKTISFNIIFRGDYGETNSLANVRI